MGSDIGSGLGGASRWALGLAARAALIGVLCFGAAEALAYRRLYATAFVLIAVALLVGLDLVRLARTADRTLSRFVEDLTADSQDRPGRLAHQVPHLAAAINAASTRLQSERVARQQRIDYLQTLADSVTAALLVVRGDGGIVLANRAAQKLAGGAISHLCDIALLGPSAEAHLLDLVPGARAILRLKDGRSVLAQASMFSTPQGEHQRLISLQDVARDLDAIELKAWQDLVRILAHEMMNSLTPIVSLATSVQTLQRQDGATVEREAEIAAALEVIARRSAGLMSFVDGYRKVAELPRPALKPVILAELVAGIDRLMGATFQARGVAYASQVEPSDLTAMIDAELLEQAIINLLTNAQDAARGADAPRVSLSVKVADGRIAIAIGDNGRGLPAESRDKLFVPFFTTKPGGSGIGLSIARQIALAHHGQLEAEDGPNVGAVFTLTLPALDLSP